MKPYCGGRGEILGAGLLAVDLRRHDDNPTGRCCDLGVDGMEKTFILRRIAGGEIGPRQLWGSSRSRGIPELQESDANLGEYGPAVPGP
jgi:hypothetical protein